MRLMIIGQLEGYISQAGKIALQKGAKVVHCEDTEQAIGALLNGKGADLVMIDVKQKIGEFVERLKLERIHIPVIACGINNDARAAVKAIQQGAKEYIPLPPDSELISALLATVTEDNNTMIANDTMMKDVVKLDDKIAPSETTVLITDESGTGKEVMSQYIHRKSKRGNGPFIAVNCAAIPENLLESELFGHEKGAFTGATARRIGKFEEATNGTLLLDEVSEMAPQLQAKLLRVLQEKEITRVGSNDAVKVDVRIIATSNRDLEAYVKSGGFREDLYFRLNVVNLRLPSLRERPTDLPVLAQFFADKYADANAVGRKKISAAATQKMKSYGWRGNIRELENTMHRAILVSMEDEIEADAIHIDTPGHLSVVPKEAAAKAESKPVQNSGAVESLIGRSVAAVERDLIINTLEHCLGNRTHAANILGISIRTLRNKLNQYKDEGVNIPASAAGE
ncbi:MAG: sigma-54-dependent Fis family transcriptional regulator [Micavibrio sp.]|nr:sigma-54-dependent Fis family transcriptional regulator [Micavibrio sp.]